MVSPGGLSLEGFVAAMLPPTFNDAKSARSQLQPMLQRQGSTHFRRQSAIKARSTIEQPRRRSISPSPSTTDMKRSDPFGAAAPAPAQGGEKRRKKRKTRRKKSSARGRRRGLGSRGGTRSLVGAEREGGGAGWSLSEEERIGVVTDLVELFQQVDHNGDQVRERREHQPILLSSYPIVVSRCHISMM